MQSCAFAFAVAGTMTAAPACAQVKWDLVSAYPAGNFHSENLMVFAKDLADVTGGKLAITVYPNASLFSATMIMSAVRIGQAQIGEVLISLHEDEGRVGMWRGGCRLNISVAASFVWRCLSGSAVTPFPHSAHRTGQADLPHPALGQNFTPSPTARRVQAGPGVRARSAHRGARVDRSRPCVA